LKILLLNQAFYPDVASTAQHASDLATRLAERGHEVSVLSSRRAYDNPRERYPKRQVWCGVQIRRISSFGFGKGSRWRRAGDFGSYLANCFLHLTTLQRFDLVIAMTSPPLISWLGALFARATGGKFVFWVMDLNPDEAVAARWLKQRSWTTKCLEAMLLYSLRHADLIITLDRFMASRIERKGIFRSKIGIVPPWPHDDAVRYDLEGRQKFRSLHGLQDKFVVMYSGNHSPCHPLATLLHAAQRFAINREIMFCFIGGGSEFEQVKTFADRNGLSNIVAIPYQPLERLAASLSSADLHVVVMGDPFVGIVHPCKIYNIRRLGIPYLYIGPKISHIGEMNPVSVAEHGDVERVVASIQAAAGDRGSNLIQSKDVFQHSQDQLVSKMAAELESLDSSVDRVGRIVSRPKRRAASA
jgi:colanic acid biosynthesis glycosyl transferase WcaI